MKLQFHPYTSFYLVFFLNYVHIVIVVYNREERRRRREERRARLEGKVQGIKDTLRKNEQGYDSDWSIPWLLVGFVVMLGYCAYYIIH